MPTKQANSKETAVFYSPQVVERITASLKTLPGAAEVAEKAVADAQPWMKFSDEELWALMFGHTLPRSWMVWSNGYCPACKHSVPMYEWRIDAFQRPWKVLCPHCNELFPKNDFYAFYRSGLDEHAVFDPSKADRSLLFNAEHPDPNDPLHNFGVDDGEGYVEGDHCWRFVATYLIYGQWQQTILEGMRRLSLAYVLTGDPAYAHKAAILLDRVADLYPTFDHSKEAYSYEEKGIPGYVSVWFYASGETQDIALVYDRIRQAIQDDRELVSFLSAKARQFLLDNPKASPKDVCRNIKDRILLDALRNRIKITGNFPRTDTAAAIMMMVLGWPGNRAEVETHLDTMLARATAVDGLTGEKGLSNYASNDVGNLAIFLQRLSLADPDLLNALFARHPNLRETYRFYVDTRCLGQYYPSSGDCGGVGQKGPYAAAHFYRVLADPVTAPSMYSFFWRLYEITGDPAYVQVLYDANGNTVEGLPYDLLCHDTAAFQRAVAEVIACEGPRPRVRSVNKKQWHLAILRSGRGNDARVVWLDYDSGGSHGHLDGLNLGLFAKGLDLMPDLGYPPVQFGGWDSPRARWYVNTASHNTVVVDGENQQRALDHGHPPADIDPVEAVHTLLGAVVAAHPIIWGDGEVFRAIRVSGPALVGGKQYERTVAMVDVSERDFYVADVFRVVGGVDHAKFTGSHFGNITTQGLSLSPSEDFGHDTQMRNFQTDPSPHPGWSADWKIEDPRRYLPEGSDVHLRYTDFTQGAEASTCEGWLLTGHYDDAWIPRVMVRRRAESAPLSSTFVAVIEPYEGASAIAAMRRLPVETADGQPFPDTCVAIEVKLVDGRRDLLISADAENPLSLSPSLRKDRKLVQRESDVTTDSALTWVRLSAAGDVERIAFWRAEEVSVKDVTVRINTGATFVEIRFDRGVPSLASGNPQDVSEVLIGGGNVWRP